ncbi:hypothetical protein [Couchioplanes azureus]|uniref:hypothetical protein n=1 Tax=Couchioplanes caeruleus TaxID=56438 RepID=UPI00166F864C|nr:hypothetical protein [Couchioplanes caeruleus]
MQIQLGRGDDTTGVVTTEPILVRRQMLVTTVEAGDWAVELAEPLKLEAGDYVWVRGAAVHVRRSSGDTVPYQGDGVWLCR